MLKPEIMLGEIQSKAILFSRFWTHMCVLGCWSVIYLIQAISSVCEVCSHLPPVKNGHILWWGVYVLLSVVLQVSLNAYCLLNAFWSDFSSIVSDENCTLEQQENTTKSYRH